MLHHRQNFKIHFTGNSQLAQQQIYLIRKQAEGKERKIKAEKGKEKKLMPNLKCIKNHYTTGKILRFTLQEFLS